MYSKLKIGVLLCILVSGVQAQTGTMEQKSLQIVSVRVEKAPAVDGDPGDDAWKAARPVEITVKRALEPQRGMSSRAWLRSLHTGTHIYFLAEWEDPTESTSHKTWVWNAEKKAYEEGSDREDMFSLAFEHSGEFDANMLADVNSVWDVWHWKAARTNPQGYAMDKTHHYSREKPSGRANEHTSTGGGKIWIARPEDSGDSVEKRTGAPSAFHTDRVPQYSAGAPSGSAADVKARGRWAAGRWTLEFARPLATGNADDNPFDPKRSYRMAIATFDKTGEMDKASGVLILTFAIDARKQ